MREHDGVFIEGRSPIQSVEFPEPPLVWLGQIVRRVLEVLGL